MLITRWLISLILVVIWKKSRWQATIFLLVFGCIEAVYFSSQITKFIEGGYIPIVSSLFLTMIMGIWHYVHKERYLFDLNLHPQFEGDQREETQRVLLELQREVVAEKLRRKVLEDEVTSEKIKRQIMENALRYLIQLQGVELPLEIAAGMKSLERNSRK